MANRATITYNGKTISTEDREGNFTVTYNGNTLATIAPGVTKTLKCSGKYMLTNVVVGGKTLVCAAKQMLADVVVAVVSLFPSEPSSYSLIGTYTSSATFTAPEDGWFQIELQGASGNGGEATLNTTIIYGAGSGGGGGGGAYACSRVQMKKGDTVIIGGNLAVGGTATVAIKSSRASYSTMQTVSGEVGGVYKLLSDNDAAGGAGGTASGGNYSNVNGNPGGDGDKGTQSQKLYVGGTGGSPGVSGGNTGGKGADVGYGNKGTPGAGAAAFVKIYRGNTNLA